MMSVWKAIGGCFLFGAGTLIGGGVRERELCIKCKGAFVFVIGCDLAGLFEQVCRK